MLKDKSIHELRGIAQGYGVDDLFSKDIGQLVQAIEMKQADMIPEPAISIPRPEYDARLMSKPPARKGSQEEIEELLAEHVARGLRLTFPEPEIWEMSNGVKNDTGTMRQPLRNILRCADAVMKTKGVIRE